MPRALLNSNQFSNFGTKFQKKKNIFEIPLSIYIYQGAFNNVSENLLICINQIYVKIAKHTCNLDNADRSRENLFSTFVFYLHNRRVRGRRRRSNNRRIPSQGVLSFLASWAQEPLRRRWAKPQRR